jgi:hypothetical protein
MNLQGRLQDQFARFRTHNKLLKIALPLIIGLGLCGVDQSLDRLWA